MKRIIFSLTMTALFLSSALVAFAANPDFSGTWVLDKEKTKGLPPGMEQTLTIKQTEDKISVDTKLIIEGRELTDSSSYSMDGKETEYTSKMSNGVVAEGKRTAKWMTDGGGIEMQTSTKFDAPSGEVIVKKTEKWTLSADGKTLTITSVQDTPYGPKETKRVFNKK